MKKLKHIILLLLGFSTSLFAQQKVTDAGLVNLLNLQSSHRKNLPVEKLYLQTDKPYYTSGDTLRFKAYLFNAGYLIPSAQSGLLYIELDDENNQTAKKLMVPVSFGLAWGDMPLEEKDIPAGTYTLRAYTNWQRNFGNDYVFKQQINISSVTNATLIKTSFKLQQKADKSNIEAALQLSTLDGNIQRLQDIQLKVMDGKKNLSKDKVNTGVDGVVKVNFDVPAKTSTNNLSIKLQQAGKEDELTIPVTVNRPENTDLQFMPEGGSLVAGIPTKVGFKAIAEDGKGVNINGTVTDSKQQQVATFSAAHAGMGSFEFTPRAGETYTARLNLPGGAVKTYPLPNVNINGTTLSILSKNDDTLQVTLNATTGTGTNENYFLIGQSRGVICYAETMSLKNGPIARIVSKDLFPTGIARFTLFNASRQALNERQVFIDHRDALQITVRPGKPNYAKRDSLALAIEVKDKDGKPIQGSFSLAVTDDSQVKTDSLGSNILNNLLLTSDLKGEVENPGYYFTGDKATELDNLLLTQGWVGYSWADVFTPKTTPPEFAPEKEFLVKGTVTNALGKPIEKSNIVLAGSNPLIFKDTLSDKNGRFTFRGLFPVDTALYRLQARNKNGKEFNVQIKADDVKPPVFIPSPPTTPWYVNSDTSLLNNAKTRIAELTAISNYQGNGRVLKEVNIKDKKVIPGSKNLNGPGEADQVIDKEEIEKANKMTLGDLLEKKIKGFFVWGQWFVMPAAGFPGTIPYSYVVNQQRIHFIFDGLDLDDLSGSFMRFSNPAIQSRTEGKDEHYRFIKSYLDYFTAEDITGIEIMNNVKYTAKYNASFSLYDKYLPESFCFIEITTRSKQGPYMKVIPGTFLYKALPFTLPKQFYSPKYTVKNKNTAIGTDLRSTIHWEPNIITDKDGKATVSFYASDSPANYTVVVEGSDMAGNIGGVIKKLTASKKTP